MNRRHHLLIAILAAFSLFAADAHAQFSVMRKSNSTRYYDQGDAKPADGAAGTGTAAPEGEALSAQVIGKKGNVESREGEGGKWKQVKVGDTLGPGAEIRTGLGSAVQLQIAGSHTITLDRLGTVQLITLLKTKTGVTKTDVGMKYGRTRYDVEAGGAVHDAKIHTPGTTLAIRGTSTGTQSDAFEDRTFVLHGIIDNTNKIRREMVRIDGNTGKAVVSTDQVTPVAFAKNKAKNDTKGNFAGRQGSENLLVEQFASGDLDDRQGGVDETQRWARAEGFAFAGVGVFGDVFDLDLFWFSTEGGASDVDLIIGDPLGGTLSPKGDQVVRAGQPTQGAFTGSPVDDDGSLGSGFETAQYGPKIPNGSFLVTVKHISGEGSSGFLDARLQSANGLFGSGNFDVDSSSPEAQFLVNPKNQTVIPLNGGGGGQ